MLAGLSCSAALGYLAGLRQTNGGARAPLPTYNLTLGGLHLVLSAGLLGLAVIFTLTVLLTAALVLALTARRRHLRAIAANNELIESKKLADELRRADERLQERNIELANANQAKSSFLAKMSHELRTPLNAIIGFTGTLLMKLPGPLNVEQDKQLRIVKTSAKHLLSVINDLLDLARIESGKVELKLEPVACGSVLEEVVTALRPQANEKGLKLELLLPDGDSVVLTDRRALSQILLNLASNAIKFTDRGSVRLEVDKKNDNSSGWTEISVIDTGIGIRREDQDKLFQEFSRVNVDSAQGVEGTGLGLQLSKRLAELLGGRILLESEYGKGSRFTLVFAKP